MCGLPGPLCARGLVVGGRASLRVPHGPDALRGRHRQPDGAPATRLAPLPVLTVCLCVCLRRQDTYAKIMKGKYVVYAEIREARDLIAGLLTLDPTKRLGCGATGVAAVREHAWFGKGGFSWEAMAERKLSPPHKPVATAESDASNFEMEDDDEVCPTALLLACIRHRC